MTDPNVLSRIEQELARTRASLDAVENTTDLYGGLCRDDWVARAKMAPITDAGLLLVRSGPLVEQEVAANMRGANLTRMSRTEVEEAMKGQRA